MTPLEILSELVARRGSPEQSKWLKSLAAREEARTDGFWQDLAGPEIWAERDSIAGLEWDDPEDAERFQRALVLIADDLDLRGFASPESRAWLQAAEKLKRGRS